MRNESSSQLVAGAGRRLVPHHSSTVTTIHSTRGLIMVNKFSIRFLTLCAIALVPMVAYAQAGQQPQQTQSGGPEVDVAQGAVSIPVKDMPVVGPEHNLKPKHEVPLRLTHPGAPQTAGQDPVLQTTTGPLVS